MDSSIVKRALQLLGERLLTRHDADVEVLLVGASAGMLTGQLPRGRTTVDCDVMVIAPRETEGALLAAADDVAVELGLPTCWFNTDVQLLIHALPMGWQDRRVRACASGRLRVDAIGRVDLLAMKVYAGRVQDLQDIRDMAPLLHELRFVAAFIDALESAGEPMAHITDARTILAELERLHAP